MKGKKKEVNKEKAPIKGYAISLDGELIGIFSLVKKEMTELLEPGEVVVEVEIREVK